MFVGSILSAAAWYADVALAALLALFLLGGLFRGFSKSTKGFFVLIFIVCVSLLLTGVTQDAAVEGGIGKGISDGLASASADWGPAFNEPVIVTEDGDYCIMVGDSPVALNGDNFGAKGTFAEFFAEKFHVEEGTSVAGAAVASVTSVCVAAIIFVIYLVGILLIFFVIRRIAGPMIKATVPGIKALDKLLGALFTTLIGLVFVWVIFAIIASLGDGAAAAKEYLANSAFAGLLYNNNPISTLFTQIFGS